MVLRRGGNAVKQKTEDTERCGKKREVEEGEAAGVRGSVRGRGRGNCRVRIPKLFVAMTSIFLFFFYFEGNQIKKTMHKKYTHQI